MQANAGIILEAVLIFGGVLIFGLWQIYAAKRDTRNAQALEAALEAAKKLAAEASEEKKISIVLSWSSCIGVRPPCSISNCLHHRIVEPGLQLKIGR